MNSVTQQLKELRKVIVYFSMILFFVFLGLLFLAPRSVALFGFHFVLPWMGSPSFAVQLFLSAKTSLIPIGIPVVALGPMSPFVAPIVMAFLVAILLSFPFGIFLMVRFLRPALQMRERRTLSKCIVPALFLFYSGCAFAYFLIIPKTFAILYSFAVPMGVEAFFALDDFIASVFFLTVSVGFSFLFPLFMIAVSRMGLVSRGFWIKHWRGAITLVIIFSAVITPDGSGVTMTLLSVPFLILYGFGALVASRKSI